MEDRHDEENLYVSKYRNGGGGGGTATDISYDDSVTQLGASNVQQAIEKLSGDKQDKLTAGTNITIDSNNVINASGGVVAEYNVVNENLKLN